MGNITNKKFSNPFNWTGSKFRYLPEIFQILPKEDTLKVLDVFLGGGDLISKLPRSWEIHANDHMDKLVEMHLQMQQGEITVDKVSGLVTKYNLDKTNLKGYLDLRESYNKNPTALKLYTLMMHSFNNQVRFNSKGDFNMPFGKDRSCFNSNLRSKLENYISSLANRNVTFFSKDWSELEFKNYDLLLVDPPYKNTCATYNEDSSWGEEDDLMLFESLDSSGTKFIYFNQTISKGTINEPLIHWSKHYNTKILRETTKNCSYQRRNQVTEEIMVWNFN